MRSRNLLNLFGALQLLNTGIPTMLDHGFTGWADGYNAGKHAKGHKGVCWQKKRRARAILKANKKRAALARKRYPRYRKVT